MHTTKKICTFLLVLVLALALTSCEMFSGLFASFQVLTGALFNKYPASTVALDALANNSADFEDLSLNDRWGLVWNGMFGIFSSTTKSDDTPEHYMPALRRIGIVLENYENTQIDAVEHRDYSTNRVTSVDPAYTIKYYHVSDKNSLTKLADLAMGLLAQQTDPETLADWIEDLYKELGDTNGKYNGFALYPYQAKVAEFAYALFDASASADSLGARTAVVYAEEYPDGAFIEQANALQQAVAGTDAALIL